MSLSKKAAKNVKSKATTNKVMARSSAKEKTKTGKPEKNSVKEDVKKALKTKAGTTTKAKLAAKVSVKAARPVAAVKAKDTKKAANKSVAIVKPAKPAVAPVKPAAAKAPAAVTAKALADKKAKIHTSPAAPAAGHGKLPSNAVKTEENKPIVKKSQQTNTAPVKSTPAPAKATASASAKSAAKSAAVAKPAAPVKAAPGSTVQATKPAAAVAAKSTDTKEIKSSPLAKETVKPAAAAKPAVAAVAPAGTPAPAAVAAPAAAPQHARPAMHQSRSPFGVRAPFPPIVRPVDPRPAAGGKPGASPKTGFKTNEYIVYPAHGVGQIIATEEQEVAGHKLELFVISFFKDKLTLKVPLPKVLAGAIRKLSDAPTVQKSLDTLTGRARVKRTMWSRRAQEYEAKINSGDLVAIAEVVRDLYRSEAQPEQSYSERQLYEAALDRMAREVAVVQKLTETESLKLIEQHLEKGPRRGSRAEAAADADGDSDGDTDAGGEVDAAA